ncbi:nuclear speckle splicing regulatory protein 1-like [Pollicipes pollicipes]|uniref:nuclear speckle splicing regulatory protein 1-like n=1 Tax=Pollicipes pollicipes TaxID=41117 RepID=UPI001885480E|nr:nuclear speckle splicing regulatory protein 1-like [Pollicipes pollicipes]
MNSGQSSQKQYGLIKTAKKAPSVALKPSVFANDSSSDEAPAPTEHWGKTALKSISHGSVQAAQTRKVIRQAMQEDASLFQYDEVYDGMQQQKQKKVEIKKTEDQKPRYMQKLLESAEQRRHQQERRMERQVQREREQEGDEFADKEAFVTEAYKKRLLEREKEEEQERRRKHIEDLTDVTKQKDLGSFYRHMFHQASSPRKTELEPAEVTRQAGTPPPEAAVKQEPVTPLRAGAAASAQWQKPAESSGRQYRPRRVSSSPETGPAAGAPRASFAEREARRRALYDKRTVGAALEEARARYLERRAARLQAPSLVPSEV